MTTNRSIRHIAEQDISYIVNYFHECSDELLFTMGVDKNKLMEKGKWCNIIAEDLNKSLHEKQFCYLLWKIDGRPIGHSNINKISYGNHAYIHMHIWHEEHRSGGNGSYFLGKCIPEYFEKFRLKKLYCEPNAHNQASNNTLARAGFIFLKEYETEPGLINFRQKVNRWVFTKD